MAIKILESNNLQWINIDAVNDEALAFLKEHFHFHHLDLEDVQSESQTPKIDTYQDYLFLVLQFPYWQAERKRVISLELDIFIGDNFLITIQHNKTKQMKNFFYRCMRNRSVKREWMSHGSGYLLYKLVESLFHNSRPILHNIGKQISQLETEIFEEDLDAKVVQELAIHRRNILGFRRIIDPQRYLMSNLSHIRKPFLDETLSLYFDDINDYLSKLWAVVTNYKDTVDGLHVTVESLLTRRTNNVISALTVISVALLPLTLLAGIYGMNIPLPLAHHPGLVWGIFAMLASVIVLVIVVMKRRRLL